MNDKGIVAVSMVWTVLLVVLSRQWLGDVKSYVRTLTGHLTAAPATASSSGRSGFTDGSAGGGSQGGGGGSW